VPNPKRAAAVISSFAGCWSKTKNECVQGVRFEQTVRIQSCKAGLVSEIHLNNNRQFLQQPAASGGYNRRLDKTYSRPPSRAFLPPAAQQRATFLFHLGNPHLPLRDYLYTVDLILSMTASG